ncbi:MAG: phosphoadenylyl-sulfate reductase [Chlorobi bacterium]|nr:phosphoadenylyl-sulfate reductase [Chlorobiota bacterium]
MVNNLTQKIQNLSIKEQLEFLAKEFKDRIAFSISFGQEDQVLTDIIFKNNISIEVFTLDTGRIFEETYKVWNITNKKYNKKITAYFPDKDEVEKMVKEKGIYSFYDSIENRKECCNIRKVYPLTRALKNVDLWITGLRAEQSVTRTDLALLEENKTFNVIKFNPLTKWTLQNVLDYLKVNNVPYNELHDKGFLSIGCAPCTRAVKEGEDIRAGRWWWESKDKKECGLHIDSNLETRNSKITSKKINI